MPTIPMVIKNEGNTERAYDIYSRMLSDRIVFLDGEVNPASASTIIAQLLFLESEDPTRDIQMYINSPGGSVTDGLAIYDTMQYIKCDVCTIAMGLAASMGAVLLAGGTKGKRFSLPNSEIMIHQPLGGFSGQASDIEIHARNILDMKERLTRILTEASNVEYDVMEALCDRDNFLTADEALQVGLIDEVVKHK